MQVVGQNTDWVEDFLKENVCTNISPSEVIRLDRARKDLEASKAKYAKNAICRETQMGRKYSRLFKKMISCRSKYTSAMHDMSKYWEKNGEDPKHDFITTDVHLLETFLTQCKLAWGSEDLGHSLEGLLDEWKEEYSEV